MAARVGARVEDIPDEPIAEQDDIEALPPLPSPPKLEKAERKPRKQYETKKKGKAGLIITLVLLAILGGVIAAVVLDFMDIRTQHIMPLARSIPIIGNMVPDTAVESAPAQTMEELQRLLTAANSRNARLEYNLQELEAQLEEATQLNRTLMPFRDHFHEYRQAVAEWNRQIAHGDPINFVEFFRYVAHENVPQLYEEAQSIIAFDTEITEQVRTFNRMDERNAAEALSSFLMIDATLTGRWLRAMTATRRAEIFDAVEENSTRVNMMMLLTPTEPTFAPIVAPYLPLPPLAPPPVAPAVPPPVVEEAPPEAPVEAEAPAEEDVAGEEEAAEEPDAGDE